MTSLGARVVLLRPEDVPKEDSWLAPQEARVLAGLRFPKRRAEWRMGRWTAKRAVAEFLDVDPGLVSILAAPDGAPEAFVAEDRAPVVISITHRAGLAAVAVGSPGVPLGCDLETLEERSPGFVRDYFTDSEQAAIASAPPEDAHCVVAVLWSAKESALKALRTGLRADTRSVEATTDAGVGACEGGRLIVRQVATGREFIGWWHRVDGMVITFLAEAVADASFEHRASPAAES